LRKGRIRVLMAGGGGDLVFPEEGRSEEPYSFANALGGRKGKKERGGRTEAHIPKRLKLKEKRPCPLEKKKKERKG